ncbi:MAG: dihydroorotase [Muribaculaceae bacterium]|nr:dihydroorotase [Muribaculaceae bacterium]
MNKILIKNARLCGKSGLKKCNLLMEDGKISAIGELPSGAQEAAEIIDANGAYLLPGLVDVHVHLREPGYSYKETIADGTRAAAHGGFTTVCTMPNLNPVPDSKENLEKQLEIISRDAIIEVLPYASITKLRMGHELVDYTALAPMVAGFSDDGTGVQDSDTMLQAMRGIAPTGKVLAAHCEVESLLHKGYIHDGEYAATHGHRGICSESEWAEVERDIRLAAETGCKLHICHISTKESVELVRRAKAEGLPVTCETGAHYIAFSDKDLQEEGRFKMNPPLRSEEDKAALIQGIKDGTIDCIASDHAPHSAEEKSRGLEKSAMGVTGLEVSASAIYTYLVKPGIISMQRMVELMADNPRKIFGISGGLQPGDRADVTLFDPETVQIVDPKEFLSKGKATPFEGTELYGRIIMTFASGKQVYPLQ